MDNLALIGVLVTIIIGVPTLIFTMVGAIHTRGARREATRQRELEERLRDPVYQAELALSIDNRVQQVLRAIGELDASQIRIQNLRRSVHISEYDPFHLGSLAFGHSQDLFDEYGWETDRFISSIERIKMIIDRTLADLTMVQHGRAHDVSSELLVLRNQLAPTMTDPEISFSRVQMLLLNAINRLDTVRGLGPEHHQP